MLRTNEEIVKSRKIYGENVIQPPKEESLLKQYLEKFKDKIIQMLLIAALVCILLGHITESVVIIIAVALATLISFINEVKSQRNFKVLNQIDDDNVYKAFRFDNDIVLLKKKELLVGDEVELEQGQEIPADCIIIDDGNLIVDESAFTGESKGIEKDFSSNTRPSCVYPNNFLLRGSKILSGTCRAKVTHVGSNTVYGKISIESSISNDIETPLNQQLNKLADWIGVVGTIVAFTIFFYLSIRHYITSETSGILSLFTIASIGIVSIPILLPSLFKLFNLKIGFTEIISSKWSWLSSILIGVLVLLLGLYFNNNESLNSIAEISSIIKYFMVAVTIIVVAVPEGLPMAVQLSFAYSVKKMLKDNNLVRKMHACETTGACTAILTDKTGTLTENKMTVTVAAGNTIVMEKFNKGIDELIKDQLIYNSTCDIDTTGKKFGSSTEIAMLEYILNRYSIFNRRGKDFEILDRQPFSSASKMMSTICVVDGVVHKFAKGAPERIFNTISELVNVEEEGYEIDNMLSEITELSNSGKRILAFYDSWGENNLVYGFVAISDPLRDGVKESIDICKNAGIKPVMVTGDNYSTAKSIAIQCGIYDHNLGEDQVALASSIINKDTTLEELCEKVKDITVVARAVPSDKKALVEAFQRNGHIVALTGDGTNDAPALAQSNIGLSMGSGTDLAKEASDIVLLNNSFNSFVKSVKWGRSIYLNIRQFLTFQLTINIATLMLAMIGPFIGIEMPFTIIQMLWINLIMDTLAALALASQSPRDWVLKEKPRDNNKFILDRDMLIHMFTFSIMQVWFLLSMLLYSENPTNEDLTVFYNFFVFTNVFGLFMVRDIKGFDIFKDLLSSKKFIYIFMAIIAVQILITEIGGEVFRLTPLNPYDYIIVIVSALGFACCSKLVTLLLRKLVYAFKN